MMNIGTLLVAV